LSLYVSQGRLSGPCMVNGIQRINDEPLRRI
jgi:hypothetical protein